MTFEEYEVEIDTTGKELSSIVWWLIENIEWWNISVWVRQNPRPGRQMLMPHRISSDNWENAVYKISGVPRNEPYVVNVMLKNDIDTMAVKLRW